MAAFDLGTFASEALSTVVWTIFGAVMAGLALVVVDRLTPKWFDMRHIGDNPTATAIFASGIVIGIGVIVAGVIMSP